MAARLPVRTVLSGPSTGVVAAQAIGAMTGIENLITFDMGGTSTDVALVLGGALVQRGQLPDGRNAQLGQPCSDLRAQPLDARHRRVPRRRRGGGGRQFPYPE